MLSSPYPDPSQLLDNLSPSLPPSLSLSLSLSLLIFRVSLTANGLCPLAVVRGLGSA